MKPDLAKVVVVIETTLHSLDGSVMTTGSMVCDTSRDIPFTEYRNEKEIAKKLREIADQIEKVGCGFWVQPGHLKEVVLENASLKQEGKETCLCKLEEEEEGVV